MVMTDLHARRAEMQSTIADLATMLSDDGAALEIVAIDEARPAIELEVRLADLDCEDCVLPPARLHEVIAAALARSTGEPVAVTLHDPRATSPLQSATVGVANGAFYVLDPTGVAPNRTM